MREADRRADPLFNGAPQLCAPLLAPVGGKKRDKPKCELLSGTGPTNWSQIFQLNLLIGAQRESIN